MPKAASTLTEGGIADAFKDISRLLVPGDIPMEAVEVTHDEIKTILKIPYRFTSCDFTCHSDREAANELSNTMSPARRKSVRSLAKHPQVQSWFNSSKSNKSNTSNTSNTSQTLIVIGSEPDGMKKPVSMLSTIPYKGGVGYDHDWGTHLYYHCGPHLKRYGDVCKMIKRGNGVVGMMRVLIEPFLHTNSVYLDSGIHHLPCQMLDDLKRCDVTALCRLFDHYVTDLSEGRPRLRVFCVIDGISWFDTAEYRHDMGIALQYLHELVNRINALNDGAVFKLLLISHVPSPWLLSLLPEEKPVFLRSTTEGNIGEVKGLFKGDASIVEGVNLVANMVSVSSSDQPPPCQES